MHAEILKVKALHQILDHSKVEVHCNLGETISSNQFILNVKNFTFFSYSIAQQDFVRSTYLILPHLHLDIAPCPRAS